MISVIIPVLNEAERLPHLLAALHIQEAAHDVIVVDGGSTDGTLEIARAGGATTIQSAPGRGGQLNAGAQCARGDILLFLHADSDLPPGALSALDRALAREPSALGGNFRLLFDGEDGFSAWLNGFYAWLRRRGYYYGDSGVFVRRTAYDQLGGFKPIPLMEDYDFVRRLERAGQTLCISAPPLVTSSRRFGGRHPVAIVTRWLKIHAYYHLGVSPAQLANIYDRQSEPGPVAVWFAKLAARLGVPKGNRTPVSGVRGQRPNR